MQNFLKQVGVQTPENHKDVLVNLDKKEPEIKYF